MIEGGGGMASHSCYSMVSGSEGGIAGRAERKANTTVALQRQVLNEDTRLGHKTERTYSPGNAG